MARKSEDIRLIVRTEVDKAIKDLDKVERNINDLDTGAKKADEGFLSLGNSVKSFIGALAIREIARGVIELGNLGAEALNVTNAFRKIPGSTQLLKELRSGVKGTVNDLELMRKALVGLDLGATNEEMKIFAEFARLEALRKGGDTLQIFDNIVSGVLRGSTELLDNFGLSLTQVNKKIEELAVKKLGKAATGLSAVERRELGVAAAAELMTERLEAAGDIAITDAEIQKQTMTFWENLQILLGKIVEGPMTEMATIINPIIKGLTKATEFLHIVAQITSEDGKKLGVIQREITQMETFYQKIKGSAAEQIFITEEWKNKLSALKEEAKELSNALFGAGAEEAAAAGKAKGGKAELYNAIFIKIKELPEMMREVDAELQDIDLLPIDEDMVRQVEENMQAIADAILRKYSIIGSEMNNVLGGPMQQFIELALAGKASFKGFVDSILAEMRRFIASQIVKSFMQILFNAVFPGSGGGLDFGSLFVGPKGMPAAQQGAHVSGSRRGTLYRVGEKNTEEIILPIDKYNDFAAGRYQLPGGFSVANIPAPQPVAPAVSTHRSVIDRTTPMAGKIQVEVIGVFPKAQALEGHYKDVEDNINEPRRKYKDRFLRKSADEVWT
jgi:hypothetical protein